MRTVLQLDRAGIPDPVTGEDPFVVKAVRSPFNVAGANKARRFQLTAEELPAWETPNGVRLRGQLIRERLAAHEGIKELLKRLDETSVNDVNPLFVQLNEVDAELISWETLCTATNEFAALDHRWPIGRVSDPMSGQSRPPAALRLPIKVMVIISAFGVNGQGQEWELFRKAVLAARGKGLDIRLKLLVGNKELRKEIDDAIAGGLAGVEVSHVDNTGSRVIQEIIAWSPNVVHFFCHGIADAGEQSLELATAGDYVTEGATGGSVKITTKQLADMSLALSNPWLLTLNCCASGKAAKDLQSMAHQIVSAGFPAAVAMLEPVDAADAHEFARAFYATLFASLSEIKKKLTAEANLPFEWVQAMHSARTAICDRHGAAENCKQWALPILYVRGVDPFHFVAAHDAYTEEQVGEFKFKAGFAAESLLRLPESIDQPQRLAVLTKMLHDVPKEFWPTPNGTFDNA